MAHQLTHEVLEHAPHDLTQAQLNILHVIAYYCLVGTRTYWMTQQDMQRRTRLSASALRQAMQGLDRRGLEVRVKAGEGRDGRPVYAHKGRSTLYRFPVFAAPAGCSCGRGGDVAPPAVQDPLYDPADDWEGDTSQAPSPVDNPPEGDTTQAPSDTKATPHRRKGDTSQAQRRLSDVALHRNISRSEGGGDSRRNHRSARDASTDLRPIQSPIMASLPDVAVVSWCGLPDCRAPAGCWPCGQAREAAEAAEQHAAEQLAAERARARQLAIDHAAAALAACPDCDADGWRPAVTAQQGVYGAVRCQHLALQGQPARAAPAAPPPGRHRAPEGTSAAS